MIRTRLDDIDIAFLTNYDTGPRPQLNVALLRKATDWVKEQAALPDERREWYQRTWRGPGEDSLRTCGTTYCMAGYVCEVSGLEWVHPAEHDYAELVYLDGETTNAAVAARRLLGLTELESELLFAGSRESDSIVELAESIAQRAGETL